MLPGLLPCHRKQQPASTKNPARYQQFLHTIFNFPSTRSNACIFISSKLTMVSPATSSWNVLILCEITPLILSRTKESLLFPIPFSSIVFFISIESMSMLFCIYSPNSLYKYSVVKKKRPLNGTIFIISCNERIIASCSFNLTFSSSTLDSSIYTVPSTWQE